MERDEWTHDFLRFDRLKTRVSISKFWFAAFKPFDFSEDMPRYDDRRNITRLYVGHLSPRIRSRDLEDIFSRYGRVRDVDMKRDYAFVEFSDPRDADDAQYSLNGREFKGSRIVVEFSKGVPRAPGGGGSSRDILGKGPPPGSGRCFNCGIDGHWARDCKAGDWKNRCYRCGDGGHIERNCQNSPKKLSRGRNYSRSPSPRRYRSRSRSYSKSRSRSASPVKRHGGRRSRSPRYSRSPVKDDRSLSPAHGRKRSLTPLDRSPSPAKARKMSLTPEEEDKRSPRGYHQNSPTKKYANLSDHSGGSPRGGRSRSRSPMEDAPEEEGRRDYKRRSHTAAEEENGRSSRSPSPAAGQRGGDGYPSDDNEN